MSVMPPPSSFSTFLAWMTPYHAPNPGNRATFCVEGNRCTDGSQRSGIVHPAGGGAPWLRLRAFRATGHRPHPGRRAPPRARAHPTEGPAPELRRPDQPGRSVDRLGRRRCRGPGESARPGGLRLGDPAPVQPRAETVGVGSSHACSCFRPRRRSFTSGGPRDHGDEDRQGRTDRRPAGPQPRGRPGARTQPLLPQRDPDVPRDVARGLDGRDDPDRGRGRARRTSPNSFRSSTRRSEACRRSKAWRRS